MTIRAGDPWGEEVPRPVGLPHYATSRSLGQAVEAHTYGHHKEQFVCTTSDRHIMQLLGLDHHERDTCLRIPIDVFSIEITTAEGRTSVIAIDTVEIGRGFFYGEWSLLTNSGFWHSQRIAGRAHPNDGHVDVVTVNRAMSFRQRLLARYRMRWGTHFPHPHISIRQVELFSWDGSPLLVRVDGERFRAVSAIRVTVLPDAVMLYV